MYCYFKIKMFILEQVVYLTCPLVTNECNKKNVYFSVHIIRLYFIINIGFQ